MIVALGGAGWILASSGAAALWSWHRRRKNAAIVDAGSAALVGGLALLYAISGDGDIRRRSAVAFMMGSWGARLAVYLLYNRVFGKPEDGRDIGFWHFQARAAAAVFFSLPGLFASLNPDSELSWVELAAAGLWIVAFTGEVTADRQLERFNSNPENSGRGCRVGLWRYARHPDYFFECMIWVAYAVFAASSAWGWLASACPAVMVYLLFVKPTAPPAVETP